MVVPMTIETIHCELCRSVELRSDDDGLALMILLHTHCVILREGLREAPQAFRLAPLTQRHAAEVVASLWPHSDPRGRYEYWYWAFNTRTPFELAEEVTEEWKPRINQVCRALFMNPLIAAIRPED